MVITTIAIIVITSIYLGVFIVITFCRLLSLSLMLSLLHLSKQLFLLISFMV